MPGPARGRARGLAGCAPDTTGRRFAVRLLLDAGLVAGGALALAAAAALIGHDGGLAYDTRAYWLAAGNVLGGRELYAPATVSDLGAYKYPPIFAQLFVPAALLPELAVAWLWRVSGVVCLRYITGSWRATVVACAFLPVLIELSLGNVTLQIAAVLIFTLRDHRGAYLLPWVAALKWGPALLVPYLWLRQPETRRPLVVGTLVFAGACAASWVAAPSAWSGYAGTFGWENQSVMAGAGVIAIVPGWGGLDFMLRFGLAAAAAVYGAASDRAWLAYLASSITVPVMALSRLAPLVGLWRFRPEAWEEPRRETSGPAPEAAPAGSGSAA